MTLGQPAPGVCPTCQREFDDPEAPPDDLPLPPRVVALAKWIIGRAEYEIPGPDPSDRITATASALAALINTTTGGLPKRVDKRVEDLTASLILGLTERQGGQSYKKSEGVAGLAVAAALMSKPTLDA